jgi:hypothetical protein
MYHGQQPEHVDVDVYLLVEPRWADTRYSRGSDAQGRPVLEGGKVVKATQSRPTVGKAGGVIAKVTMRIDAGCFLPLQPEAVIHIHPGNAETIEVEAIDPRIDEPEV